MSLTQSLTSIRRLLITSNKSIPIKQVFGLEKTGQMKLKITRKCKGRPSHNKLSIVPGFRGKSISRGRIIVVKAQLTIKTERTD